MRLRNLVLVAWLDSFVEPLSRLGNGCNAVRLPFQTRTMEIIRNIVAASLNRVPPIELSVIEPSTRQ